MILRMCKHCDSTEPPKLGFIREEGEEDDDDDDLRVVIKRVRGRLYTFTDAAGAAEAAFCGVGEHK